MYLATPTKRRSRAPTGRWRSSTIPTGTQATKQPKNCSKSQRRPTRCSPMARSVRGTIASDMPASARVAAGPATTRRSSQTSATSWVVSATCSGSAVAVVAAASGVAPTSGTTWRSPSRKRRPGPRPRYRFPARNRAIPVEALAPPRGAPRRSAASARDAVRFGSSRGS